MEHLNAQTREFVAVLRIMKDDEEQFPVLHDRYQVPEQYRY
jgi:hypothetical protein